MATTASPSPVATGSQLNTYPTSSLRFDWIMTLLSSGIVVGVYIDGWAHSHGRTDSSFFTPWHALLYSAFALAAGFLVLSQWRNVQKGYPFARSLPVGYRTSLFGVGLFAFGGFADMLWHTIFGLEKTLVEVLVSPSHLLLAAGGIAILTGGLRSGWYRLKQSKAHSWLEIAPVIIAVALMVAGIAFFTQYNHPYRGNLAAVDGLRTMDNLLRSTQGVGSIIVQTGILMASILLIARRWRLPFGWITLTALVGFGMITILDDSYFLLPSILIGGLLSDVAYTLMKPYEHPTRYYGFAFLMPMIFFGVYLAWIALTLGGLQWRVHVWTGTLLLSGMIGLLISFMYLSPLHDEL